jgi:chemosensory pili system protein ChpA (sensor histidine kinase/response regulator)
VNPTGTWSLKAHHQSTAFLAHSLAGTQQWALPRPILARGLEHALELHNHHIHGANAYGDLFIEASEDIRLHQFAAGFLRQPCLAFLNDWQGLSFLTSVIRSYDDGREGFDDLMPVDAARAFAH